MVTIIRLLFLGILLASPNSASAANKQVLIGMVPGEYLGLDESESHLAAISVNDRVIEKVEPFARRNLERAEVLFPEAKVVPLTRDGLHFDVVYPALINLHNHTKQNTLPVWHEARGQFENRFEWRAWSQYKRAVSANFNPWIGYGRASACAAFRWSELMALSQGTGYLQGPSSCIDDFAIHQVEDKDSVISRKAAVQAPTDIVIPADMIFVWETLGPIIRSGKTYEEALAQVLTEGTGTWPGCPGLRGLITPQNINERDALAILSNQRALRDACGLQTPEDVERAPRKLLRYVYWLHKGVAGKKKFIADARYSALIAHLGEGRREDAYNRVEFEILELLGLLAPRVNLVHALGLDRADLTKVAQNQMGIVWSPFSNLVLYGETIDWRALRRAEREAGEGKKILVALGSDWTPTGTKGPLEELKVAKAYIQREKLEALVTDRDLYRMVTENPARMIHHWDINSRAGEAGIGRIAAGAMASLIVVPHQDPNPYTNLVDHTNERHISLVMIDGKATYGVPSLLAKFSLDTGTMEDLSQHFAEFDQVRSDPAIPRAIGADGPDPSDEDSEDAAEEEETPVVRGRGPTVTAAQKAQQLVAVARSVENRRMRGASRCELTEPKLLVAQDTLMKNNLSEFLEASGLNLDRYQDLFKLLAVNLLTQSRNFVADVKGPIAVENFPPLLSCNDPAHERRIREIVRATGEDENSKNISERNLRRQQQGLGAVPARLAALYGLSQAP